MSKKTIISAENISIGYAKTKYRDKTALYKGLSFDLCKGELACLLGANGAGKSTLLRTIGASQPSLKGKVFLDDRPVDSYSEKELSRLLGLVLTDKTSAGGLRVRELVELGRYPYTGFFGQLTRQDKDAVQKALEDVCIIHKADVHVAELSDGERQKTMIAKVLAQESPVVLLDEPTAFLDMESRIEIMNLLRRLTVNQGKTILLSTHDIDLALLLADRLWLLSGETGLTAGVTEDIVLSGAMDKFFKGGNIIFDKSSGNFLPNRKSDRKALLQADGYLYHWTRNMLERHGISASGDMNDSLFSLTVSASDSINVRLKNGTTRNYENYEQLADFIKDI
ncbi:MAG: ABC transporter ATP-binding protein [Prevotella sp.]|jgi:iron complex transport system ATP-binding protein|nr:ABC transporter ATP-binding protein [Prevotella sp.]